MWNLAICPLWQGNKRAEDKKSISSAQGCNEPQPRPLILPKVNPHRETTFWVPTILKKIPKISKVNHQHPHSISFPKHNNPILFNNKNSRSGHIRRRLLRHPSLNSLYLHYQTLQQINNKITRTRRQVHPRHQNANEIHSLTYRQAVWSLCRWDLFLYDLWVYGVGKFSQNDRIERWKTDRSVSVQESLWNQWRVTILTLKRLNPPRYQTRLDSHMSRNFITYQQNVCKLCDT